MNADDIAEAIVYILSAKPHVQVVVCINQPLKTVTKTEKG